MKEFKVEVTANIKRKYFLDIKAEDILDAALKAKEEFELSGPFEEQITNIEKVDVRLDDSDIWEEV